MTVNLEHNRPHTLGIIQTRRNGFRLGLLNVHTCMWRVTSVSQNNPFFELSAAVAKVVFWAVRRDDLKIIGFGLIGLC